MPRIAAEALCCFAPLRPDAIKRREDLAAGLDIDEVQVFLSRHRGRDGSARRVTLWVADEDPYAEKPPVSPLATLESPGAFEMQTSSWAAACRSGARADSPSPLWPHA